MAAAAMHNVMPFIGRAHSAVRNYKRRSRPDPMQRRVLLHVAQEIREHQKGRRPVRCMPRRPQQRTRSARGAASSVPSVSTVVGLSYFHLHSANEKVSATEPLIIWTRAPR